MDSQDPIIKSMQDKRSEPPKPGAGPAPKPPMDTPGGPPKGLGEPPSSETTRVSYKPPEPPRPALSRRGAEGSAISTPPPPLKGVPELPKPMKPLYEERVKLPRGEDGTPKINLVLLIITILLLLLSLFLLYNKIGDFEKNSGENETVVKESVEDMNAKLDLTIQKIQEEEAETSTLKQSLFDAGASLQKCADELVMEGEKLVADGDALKKEGEAADDQSKIDRGQNQMDRGNAMRTHGTAYNEEGRATQAASGMEGNK